MLETYFLLAGDCGATPLAGIVGGALRGIVV